MKIINKNSFFRIICSILLLNVLYIFNSCNDSKEETLDNVPKPAEQILIKSALNNQGSIKSEDKALIDTVIIELGDRISFNEYIDFGMNVKEWNKAIALLVKKGEFELLSDETIDNSYYGVNIFRYGPASQKQFFFGNFDKPNKELSPNKIELVRVGNEIISDLFLVNIHTKWEKININQANTFINKYLRKYHLKQLCGDENIPLDPEIIIDLESANMMRNLRRQFEVNDINKDEHSEKFELRTKSLYSNGQLYFAFKVVDTQHIVYKVSTTGEYTSVKNKIKLFDVYLDISPIKFNKILIKEYLTEAEINNSILKNQQEDLINKALNAK